MNSRNQPANQPAAAAAAQGPSIGPAGSHAVAAVEIKAEWTLNSL